MAGTTRHGADRELVYGRLMKELLPAGAMGLLVAAMMAATMSTVGDNLNFGSQVMVSDIYRRYIVRPASEKHYMMMSKVAMALIMSVARCCIQREYHYRCSHFYAAIERCRIACQLGAMVVVAF